MKSGILYFIYFLALISQPVHAVKVSGLYQATISVSDESVSKRRIALKQALGKVLVKVTGDRNIKKNKTSGTANYSKQPKPGSDEHGGRGNGRATWRPSLGSNRNGFNAGLGSGKFWYKPANSHTSCCV